MDDYYVYVYIDPRNLEEFYFGKGKGTRKSAHLADVSDSRKAARIAAIRKVDLEPVVRVIARGLSEREALLVEKTLLWKLGSGLTNESGGHYQDKFRPKDTMHRELANFDFRNGLWYYNVGQSNHRNWDDYRAHGFISAGQAIRRRDAMKGFRAGDIVVAYLKRRGYVGVARILTEAVPAGQMLIGGTSLLSLPLKARHMDENAHHPELAEFVCRVEWLRDVAESEAVRSPGQPLFSSQLIRASLDNQSFTVDFLERKFGVGLREAAY